MTFARVTDTRVDEHGSLYATPRGGVNGNVPKRFRARAPTRPMRNPLR